MCFVGESVMKASGRKIPVLQNQRVSSTASLTPFNSSSPRRPLTHPPHFKETPLTIPEPPYTLTYQTTPTLPLLFRFSALTLNAHRIHYDSLWAREREGHSESPYGGAVVHGPLSALICVELVERWLERESEGRGRKMKRFEYRATGGMYVDRLIEVFGKLVRDGGEEGEGGQVLRLWVVQDGRVGMVASARFC